MTLILFWDGPDVAVGDGWRVGSEDRDRRSTKGGVPERRDLRWRGTSRKGDLETYRERNSK